MPSRKPRKGETSPQAAAPLSSPSVWSFASATLDFVNLQGEPESWEPRPPVRLHYGPTRSNPAVACQPILYERENRWVIAEWVQTPGANAWRFLGEVPPRERSAAETIGRCIQLGIAVTPTLAATAAKTAAGPAAIPEGENGATEPPVQPPRSDERAAVPASGTVPPSKPTAGEGDRTPKAPGPLVILGEPGDQPMVRGILKPRLTLARYNTVKALLDAGDAGLSGDDMVLKSGHGGAVNTLKSLAKSDPDWASVILLPGQPGRRYRIASV
jgi:hypothetical protein